MTVDAATATTATTPDDAAVLPVGIVGFGWMGRAHAQAYARIRHHYPELRPVPKLMVIADEVPVRAAEAAAQFDVPSTVADWQRVVDDPMIKAVSVTAPNFLHREIGCAVVSAGKHLWIEKPVGLSADDAAAVATAARATGVRTAVGFNYRNVPAVAAAREMIASGGIGEVTHARFRLFSDYAAHPDGALSWRFQRARGGNGVLGDLASHGADLVWFLLGDVESVVADTAVFVTDRPRPTGTTSGHQLASGGERGPVENEDYVSAQMRMTSGARCVLEASRVSVGAQNSYGFEIHGTEGVVRWDYRRMGELEVGSGQEYQDLAVATRFVGPGAGDYAAFQPGAANPMSYDDLKVIEAARFCASVTDPAEAGATIDDAVRSARVLDAMSTSVREGTWVSPDTQG
ncbi:Gfo/Idh/MocA family oxidoreductase [Gordonia sp. SID5947]|uniref:Gfo/Idh/MocA family protein n=1 Tax=Gordonia sp. SID5947 TaxID=2690315 RepID=UPI0013697B3D|nr:Gfo/Idh/MocA family oxidoreductase [Gordonia sp. SID5947]MYR08865.1 Gfo/Idh/MocA family oxidoreductase [Gordonia sp. SID5947]